MRATGARSGVNAETETRHSRSAWRVRGAEQRKPREKEGAEGSVDRGRRKNSRNRAPVNSSSFVGCGGWGGGGGGGASAHTRAHSLAESWQRDVYTRAFIICFGQPRLRPAIYARFDIFACSFLLSLFFFFFVFFPPFVALASANTLWGCGGRRRALSSSPPLRRGERNIARDA